MEDQFFHFAQTRTKAQICATFPDFPTSFLHETVADLGRKIVHMPADLPYQYRSLSFLTGGRLPEIDLPQAEMPSGSPPEDFSKQIQEEGTSRKRKRGKNNWHNDVHERIRPLTANLRKKNVKLTLSHGLKAANMTFEDLPEMKGICWKFVLGSCPMGKRCKYVHPAAKEIPDSVMKKALPPLTKLAKGLEKCSAQGGEGGGQQETPVNWG